MVSFLNRTPNSLSIIDRFTQSVSQTMFVGNVFFVGSTADRALNDASSRGDTPEDPFATTAFAISQCTANQGDVIFWLPGHTENLTADLTVNVAGISLIGLGHGLDAPLFTAGDTDGTMTVSANSVIVDNLIMNCSIAASVSAVAWTGTNGILRNLKTGLDDNTTDEYTRHLNFDTADECVIENCWIEAHTAAGSTTALRIDNCNRLIVRNNYFTGFFGGATISGTDNSAAASTGLIIHNNMIQNTNIVVGGPVDMHDNSTGEAFWNMSGHDDTAAADGSDWGDLHPNENYGVGVTADESGVLVPTATAT